MVPIVAQILLSSIALPAVAADLAPEAAYSVTISGYVYRGQVIPGTNTPAMEQGFSPAPPWQGPRTALTDGKRDGEVVHSWFWSQMDKRITARLDLRRAAQVHRVQVWPQRGAPNYDGATVRIATTEEALAETPEIAMTPADEGMAWTGPAVGGRFVEVTCQSGLPQMTLAEVSIQGEPEGPPAPDAPAPGLISIPPRDLEALIAAPTPAEDAINLAREPGVKVRVASRHYDDKTGTEAEDDSAALSDPGGGALNDGRKSGGVRSFSGWFCSKRIQAQFTPASAADLDHLLVWSSGHGERRSYINCVRVWLQAGEGAPWTPAGETWNAVLPGETPAPEYPIVVSPVDGPATSVRLELVGVAQSADFLQVGEIELWGRPAAGKVTARPWRVKTPVPPIEPVATGKPAAAYRWLQDQRLRGIYGYAGQWEDEGLLQRICAAGFNCMIVHTMGNSHSEAGWPEEAGRWARVQSERRLRVIVSWPFGSDERWGNTQFGGYQPGGAAIWRRGPCPLSSEYWNRVVGDRAVIAAEAGLAGMVVDMEMYGADSARYPGPCFCDRCWEAFVTEHLEGVEAEKTALADRPAWIAANELAEDYARRQELEVTAILEGIRARVRAIEPDFLLGNLLGPESLPGLARGFGTPEMPALVFSELEYHGDVSGVAERVARLGEEGYPVWYVPGLWLKPVTPPELPALLRSAAPISGGYWLWSTAAFSPDAGGPFSHADSYSHDDYWRAFGQANEGLTEALGEGQTQRPQ